MTLTRKLIFSAVLLVAASTVAHPVVARVDDPPKQPRLDVETYLEWEQVSDPQISPDGSLILYTRQWINRLEDKWESAIWIMGGDGGKNRFLMKGSNARWSPDGTRIVWLAEGEPKGTQIFMRWLAAEGASTQVTHLTETPTNIQWSPDGRQFSFTMITRKEEGTWKIDMPAPPKGASWTEAPKIIEARNYRLDRQGFLEDGWTHLYVVAADGGTPRQLTRGQWNVGGRPDGLPFSIGTDWTPDGQEIVFDGLMEPDADDRYRESHIYAVRVKTGEIRKITKEKGPWINPVVSPDGKTIAFTGFAWTDQTYKTDELHIIGLDGEGMKKISGDLDRDPENLNWAADGSGLYFNVDDQGSSNVLFAPVAGGVRRITEGKHMLALSSVAMDGAGAGGVAVGTRSSPKEPADIVRFSPAAPAPVTRLTHVNDDLLEGRQIGEVEEIWYTSADGTKVQGWTVKPPEFDAKQKYPLILHIHGGPHAMYNVAFNYSFQNLAANGYVVLYTNPRGSTGYGTSFGNAIDDAYPGVDYDDLMAGVDAVIGRGYVDTTRMYVTGVSGGGVLSSWIIGHTDRFAAAAVRAPVINWISFAGTTDITAWGYARFRGYFWDNPDRWLKHSPLMYVKNVKTPALMMTGVLDLRTPMGQTEEYYQALKAMKVPTAMIRFNGEYHGTGSKPSNFMRTQLYLMNWFKRYTKP